MTGVVAGSPDVAAGLAALPLLADLPAPASAVLAGGSRIVSVRSGAVVVAQGGEPQALYGVLEGRLKVVRAQVDGAVSTLNILGRGDVLGEIAFFADGGRTAHVVAMEPTRLLEVRGEALLEALAIEPQLGRRLLGVVATRLAQMVDHFDDVRGRDVAQRLARKLQLLVTRFGSPVDGGIGVQLRLTQTELAELADTTRQSVNKYLRRWQATGCLVHERGMVIVRDLEQLRALAEDVG